MLCKTLQKAECNDLQIDVWLIFICILINLTVFFNCCFCFEILNLMPATHSKKVSTGSCYSALSFNNSYRMSKNTNCLFPFWSDLWLQLLNILEYPLLYFALHIQQDFREASLALTHLSYAELLLRHVQNVVWHFPAEKSLKKDIISSDGNNGIKIT